MLSGWQAMLSVKSHVNKVLALVNVVKDAVSVSLVTSCEYHYLKMLCYFFQEMHKMRPEEHSHAN